MSDVSSQPPAAPPAGDDPLRAVLGAVARLAEQQQSLVDLFRSAGPASPAAAQPSLKDELRSLVTGLFKEHQAAATRSAARDAYLREHVADLPDAYRRLLPETDDPAALSAAEQAVRRQFREDLKSILRTPGDAGAHREAAAPSIGFQATGGAPPAAAIDYSKLSPLQQIAVGLRGVAAERIPPTDSPPERAAGADAPSPDPHDALFVGAD
jgi:hypothetical protein